MSILNETIYDENIIGEAAKLLTRKYKRLIGLFVVLLVFMAGYLFFAGAVNIVVIPAASIVIIIVLGVVKVKSYRNMLLQRIKVVNHEDAVKCRYTIDDEKMTIETSNGVQNLSHSDIKKVHETNRLYLIIYSGGVFAILSKDGFEENAESEFRKVVLK